MLYIWPYIMFFSWPVIVPHVIHLLSGNLQSLKSKLPRIMIAILVMAIMVVTVHLNTTVHPFTLADNRHYIFYVFRLLLRNRLTKYVAVPVYFICAWAAIAASGNGSATPEKMKARRNNVSKDSSLEQNPSPLRTSFLLVFLTSTALSLITAPLVEPRYFILPWLIWRLHVDPPRPSQSVGLPARIMLGKGSTWLYVETAWFLVINLATCWLFLCRGFEWEQEAGAVQRFIW
jgi:alpha-1,2-glucosyltransferase